MNTSYQLKTIDDVAQRFWQEKKHHKIFAFYAPMGAGKTTFIHALCNGLQVTDAVTSPTFALINEYKSLTAGTIYHMDWYRIKNEDEAIQAGIEDCLLSGNICFIEWPEKAIHLLPQNTLSVHIEIINEDTRRLSSGNNSYAIIE